MPKMTEKQEAMLERDFIYHDSKPEQVERYEAIRAKAKELAEYLCNNVIDSKELNIALIRLNEVVMWANAAIARNEP